MTRLPRIEVTRLPRIEVTRLPRIEVTRLPRIEVTRLPRIEVTRFPCIEVTRFPCIEVTEFYLCSPLSCLLSFKHCVNSNYILSIHQNMFISIMNLSVNNMYVLRRENYV